jgi:DnaJ-class molecular chaperone
MMDISDIAAAALKPEGIGVCNCSHYNDKRKPNPRCPKCHGSGKLTACLACEGSGWMATANTVCPQCQGNGYRPPETPATRSYSTE